MFHDLASLAKPRIVGLLCLTGTSAVLAAGGTDPVQLIGFVVAGGLVAGGSAALNCYYDRDLDRHMERTADRPLPSGALDARIALAFALALLALGTLIGVATVPLVAVGYMWLGVAAYVGLYTVTLKRRHPIGVVLGGSAGSFPVLAGWSVVEPIGPAAIVMAALVFVWTPAHAWALAYVYRADFRAADVPTLPAVTPLERVQLAVWWSAVVTVVLAAAFVPFVGPVYGGGVLAGSACLLLAYRSFAITGSEPTAVRAFFTSNLFLALCFLGWAVDGLVTVPAWLSVVVAGLTLVAFRRLWLARPSLDGVAGAVDFDLGRSVRRGVAALSTVVGR